MRLHGGLRVELKIIRTKGDRLQRRGAGSPSEALPKGLFTAELERALLDRSIDLAVHSLKDLPVDDPDGLVVAAVPARASAHDVLITRGPSALQELQDRPVIATGSPRRRLEILRVRPDAEVVPIRGNVDTRIEKLRKNIEWQGIILAEAGISRLRPNLSGLVMAQIPFDHILPAPGQGALAVQVRSGDDRALGWTSALDDARSRLEVAVERAFLRGIGGGCGIPLGALAKVEANDVALDARLYGENGALQEIRGCWAMNQAIAGAEALAREAVSSGD